MATLIARYVFFWTGRHILRMAWGAARPGIVHQHVLLTAGATAGYIGGLLGSPIPFTGWYGFYGFPPVDFYGVVVFLATYHLLSGFVSLKVRTRASQSVRKLLDMQPPTARVVRDGRDEEVAIEIVQTGDPVRIRRGERVPVDGEVVEGRGAVDAAVVTGVQNLVFAFSFNAVGVPLAATGLVHPVWAMIAMAASVTAVLLNSFGGRLLPRRTGPQEVAETAAGRKEVSPAEAKAEVAAIDVAAIDGIPPGAPTEVHAASCD